MESVYAVHLTIRLERVIFSLLTDAHTFHFTIFLVPMKKGSKNVTVIMSFYNHCRPFSLGEERRRKHSSVCKPHL